MVSRAWRAFGLRPHRTETFNPRIKSGGSRDPAFVDKVRDVVDLSMGPTG